MQARAEAGVLTLRCEAGAGVTPVEWRERERTGRCRNSTNLSRQTDGLGATGEAEVPVAPVTYNRFLRSPRQNYYTHGLERRERTSTFERFTLYA